MMPRISSAGALTASTGLVIGAATLGAVEVGDGPAEDRPAHSSLCWSHGATCVDAAARGRAGLERAGDHRGHRRVELGLDGRGDQRGEVMARRVADALGLRIEEDVAGELLARRELLDDRPGRELQVLLGIDFCTPCFCMFILFNNQRPAPSPRTNPSRVLSNGRDADLKFIIIGRESLQGIKSANSGFINCSF